MALIDKHAQVIEDEWTYHDADGSHTKGGHSVIPFDALSGIVTVSPAISPLGVFVPAGTAADGLIPYLGRLDLIVVEFPKFRDGRGFTIARTIREKHGFKGDIRASGYVLPDQFAFLVQCGFSSVLLPAEHPPEQWQSVPGATRATSGGPLLQRLLRERGATSATAENT